MISESHSYYAKVEEYFERLETAIEHDYYEKVTSTVAKLSRYAYMFNQDQQDAYDEAVIWLDNNEPWEDEYDPTEYDEWQSYDPDC